MGQWAETGNERPVAARTAWRRVARGVIGLVLASVVSATSSGCLYALASKQDSYYAISDQRRLHPNELPRPTLAPAVSVRVEFQREGERRDDIAASILPQVLQALRSTGQFAHTVPAAQAGNSTQDVASFEIVVNNRDINMGAAVAKGVLVGLVPHLSSTTVVDQYTITCSYQPPGQPERKQIYNEYAVVSRKGAWSRKRKKPEGAGKLHESLDDALHEVLEQALLRFFYEAGGGDLSS